MRRFITSAALLFFAIPFGVSVTGCHKAAPPSYCNGENSGVIIGQLTTLNLQPRLTGLSLNQGQIGQSNAPSGTDCKGNTAAVGSVIYATSNINLVDVQPTTGRLCGGSWNRNTGGGIADFTYCTPTTQSGVSYLTTSAGAVVSNPIPVYVHPVVTSIVLGPPSANCSTDPASDCLFDATQANGCAAGPPGVLPDGPNGIQVVPYSGTVCISQGFSTQLIARAYGAVPPFAISSYSIASGVATFTTVAQSLVAGETVTLSAFPTSTFLNGQVVTVLSTGLSSTSFEARVASAANVALTREPGIGTGPTTGVSNISCLVGPLTFGAQNASIATIDNTQAVPGLATAAVPGSTTINATISQASSTAGFFSTCPPASIVLSAAGSAGAPAAPVVVNENSTQTFVAAVTDTLGNPITNIPLSYISTTPTTIPIASNSVTPPFPGATTITAICQPPGCNPSPIDEIGNFGNGTEITSNPIQVNAIGTGFNTVLYVASSNSQYLLPIDFTLTTQSVPVRLPYVPNSLQLSTDLTTIYMGTPNEIMIFSTSSNALTKEDASISGTVLSVAPNSGTVIVTDPVRQLIYLYTSAGAISAEYGGVANSASWSPDSQTVYITTTDGRLLVYSTFTGWTAIPLTAPATNVAVTIPNAGVYLAEGATSDVRTNCPQTTVVNPGLNATTTNVFYPDIGPVALPATDLAATNDGLHIFGANTSTFTDVTTNKKGGACPVAFTSAPGPPMPLGVAAATITNLLTTSDSAYAFVTYTGTGGSVPQYTQSAIPGTPGSLKDVKLTTYTTAPIAPVSGVISADNNTLYVGTTGDNLVHKLIRGAGGFTDSASPSTPPINPQLPAFTGSGFATPNFLAQRPRKATT